MQALLTPLSSRSKFLFDDRQSWLQCAAHSVTSGKKGGNSGSSAHNQFAGRVFNWIICFVLSYQFLCYFFIIATVTDAFSSLIRLSTWVLGCAAKYAIVFYSSSPSPPLPHPIVLLCVALLHRCRTLHSTNCYAQRTANEGGGGKREKQQERRRGVGGGGRTRKQANRGAQT